jgi:hypothetical protein
MVNVEPERLLHNDRSKGARANPVKDLRYADGAQAARTMALKESVVG